MLIGLAITALPVVILAGGQPQPGDKTRHCDTGSLGPALDEIDHGITDIVGNPIRF